MKRTGIELLESGVKIDWDSHHTAQNRSAKRNYQRRIKVSCIQCRDWRWINSCCLTIFRKGKKGYCWNCHKKNLAKKNQSGVSGKHYTQHGYVIRTMSSFTSKEIEFLKPMMRSPSKKRRENLTEVLEHRALMALYLGRVLEKSEVIHHKNGIKDDNRIENLELTTSRDHSKYHNIVINENKQLKRKVELLQQELDLALSS